MAVHFIPGDTRGHHVWSGDWYLDQFTKPGAYKIERVKATEIETLWYLYAIRPDGTTGDRQRLVTNFFEPAHEEMKAAYKAQNRAQGRRS